MLGEAGRGKGCPRKTNPAGAEPPKRRRPRLAEPDPALPQRRRRLPASPQRRRCDPRPPATPAPLSPLYRHPGLNAAKGVSRPPSLPMTGAERPSPPQPIPRPAWRKRESSRAAALPRGAAEAPGDVSGASPRRAGRAVNGCNRRAGGRLTVLTVELAVCRVCLPPRRGSVPREGREAGGFPRSGPGGEPAKGRSRSAGSGGRRRERQGRAPRPPAGRVSGSAVGCR